MDELGRFFFIAEAAVLVSFILGRWRPQKNQQRARPCGNAFCWEPSKWCSQFVLFLNPVTRTLAPFLAQPDAFPTILQSWSSSCPKFGKIMERKASSTLMLRKYGNLPIIRSISVSVWPSDVFNHLHDQIVGTFFSRRKSPLLLFKVLIMKKQLSHFQRSKRIRWKSGLSEN